VEISSSYYFGLRDTTTESAIAAAFAELRGNEEQVDVKGQVEIEAKQKLETSGGRRYVTSGHWRWACLNDLMTELPDGKREAIRVGLESLFDTPSPVEWTDIGQGASGGK
jgi:hypothetical protein